MMRKVTIFLAIITASAWSVAAQTPARYQVDNFDFANAVQIQTPKPEPAKKPKELTKRLIQAKNYTQPADALIHLTSQQTNPSLNGFTTVKSVTAFRISESRDMHVTQISNLRVRKECISRTHSLQHN